MSRRIRILAGNLSVIAELNDSKTAAAIQAVLPLETAVSTWGDEIYFRIPLEHRLEETAVEIVDVGDLGYWPTGRAFCIFFGPTPASHGEEIRPASAVNLVGKVLGDARVFRTIREGELVRLEDDG